MDAKRIHEEITHLLYKVEEQYGRIIQHKDSIPLLEIDLALKDVRDLYEVFIDLRTSAEIKRRKLAFDASQNDDSADEDELITSAMHPSSPSPVIEEIPVPEPVAEIPVQEEEKAGEIVSEIVEKNIPELPIVAEEPVVAEESIAEEPVVEEPAAVEASKEKEVPKQDNSGIAWQKTFDASKTNAPAEAPVSSPKKDLLQERQKDFVPTVRKIEFKPEPITSEPRKESIFDKATSLFDKISKPAEKTVASAATRQPISNIKAAIGINEKFAYLKDLFKNNVNEYNQALDKLNNFDNYTEAEDYFQELKAKYSWDPETKSFQGLADLLSRRYLHSSN
jgi:hypothetical protein